LTPPIFQIETDINLDHLTSIINGFVLTCRVEGKSPNTVTFYKGILDRFAWYLKEFNIAEVNPITIRSFVGYIQST